MMKKKKKKEEEGRRNRSSGVVRHTTLYTGRDRKITVLAILR